MSESVTRRLREIAERGVERRARTAETREQAGLLIETLGWLHIAQRRWSSPDPFGGRDSTTAEALPQQSVGVLDRPQALIGDVLDQAQSLLEELDVREREHWNEDDDRILQCLMQVWAAAVRRGYTLQDLQKILQALDPPA